MHTKIAKTVNMSAAVMITRATGGIFNSSARIGSWTTETPASISGQIKSAGNMVRMPKPKEHLRWLWQSWGRISEWPR